MSDVVELWADFLASLSLPEWLLIVTLLATMVLVALAAAAFGNPVNLDRRPTPLPARRPDWVSGRAPARPVSDPPEVGRHRADGSGQDTTNLSGYRDRMRF